MVGQVKRTERYYYIKDYGVSAVRQRLLISDKPIYDGDSKNPQTEDLNEAVMNRCVSSWLVIIFYLQSTDDIYMNLNIV